MNIVLMGDSITDMGRSRELEQWNIYTKNGYSYAFYLDGEFASKHPGEYNIINRGISGNRTVDIYARIKSDCWSLEPDVLSVYIGVNDVWHEITSGNGVELDRFERFYRMYIEETKAHFPEIKLMLLEPFVLDGPATHGIIDKFEILKDYAKVVEGLAKEYGAVFVPLRARFEELIKIQPVEYWLYDGVHPTNAGSKIIAEEWLKGFEKLNK